MIAGVWEPAKKNIKSAHGNIVEQILQEGVYRFEVRSWNWGFDKN